MAEINKFYIRFLNAVSDMSEVEFYANDKLISTLNYKAFSEYYPANIGSFKISVYEKSSKTLLAEEVLLFEHDVYTLALSGLKEELTLNIVKSESETPSNTNAQIRFVNLAPYDTSFNIFINKNKTVDALAYEEITEFFSLNGGSYRVELYDVTTGEIALTNPKMVLKNNKIYSVYIVGVENVGSGLQMLIPLEGTSYIEM